VNRPVWAAELAEQFWRTVGGRIPAPRDLRRPIARAWPLTVVPIAGLSVRAMSTWLARVGVDCPLGVPERRLHGGLAAWNGSGFLFVAGDDEPAEQRFTIAHELAHFLRDYWQPRERAAAALGAGARAMVDGFRTPRPEERLHALLRNVPLALHTHLLNRGGEQDPSLLSTAESDADVLACELLAPADEVFERLVGEEAEAADGLESVWGLPRTAARRYAALLFPAPRAEVFLEKLRKFFPSASNFGESDGIT
jgi:hypothetical protein